MKSSWQILMLFMGVALVVLSLKVSLNNEELKVLGPRDRESIILDNIMTRSSVRNFTSKPISQERIETLLRAGISAPSAGNKQTWDFVVITDRKILDAIPAINKGTHMAKNAKLAITVVGAPAEALEPDYWMMDASAATENILLAAHAMGLGAVWTGIYPENGTGRVKALQKLLNLPEGKLPLNVIVIGYPVGESIVKDKWKPEKIHYNSFSDQSSEEPKNNGF